MVQQKDSAKAKQQRREMAQLLEVGKVQSARIRVENIIRSDITTELHEILELYCELLLARSQLLETSSPASATSPAIPLDPALEEAVRSIIYAAPRTEVKEMHTVRALLVEKFGKDVALASIEGEGVAERVVKKLKVTTPSEELVDAYLSEIARFYGVPFGESKASADDGDDDDDEPSSGIAEPEGRSLEDPLENDGKKEDEREELVKATPPRKLGPQSPLRVVPPSPSSDNVAPKLKLPGSAAAKVANTDTKKEDGLGKIPDVDELAKRFAQLKR
ncbi:regulator of Vps4 activity in the MVB pathway-domain-containing protein [Ampelomyces quisqualis]|uniref:Regulator of Vps4 activity in the MVB pathway-domain-containing protein n=1 Tax=Ampelomyces quisqualis TaxID=50730 RepID=A0A6A5QZK6_AMPQU|nr:regulator of Vps4 activity in the MVB pathway-domain-containing protein [Ampelomyces quisqualis]